MTITRNTEYCFELDQEEIDILMKASELLSEIRGQMIRHDCTTIISSKGYGHNHDYKSLTKCNMIIVDVANAFMIRK